MSKKLLAYDWFEITGMMRESFSFLKMMEDYYSNFLCGRIYTYGQDHIVDLDGDYYLSDFDRGDRLHLMRCNLKLAGVDIARIAGIGRSNMLDKRHFGLTYENRYLWENLGVNHLHMYDLIGQHYVDDDKSYPRVIRIDYSVDGFQKLEALDFVLKVLKEVEYTPRYTEDKKSKMDNQEWQTFYWGSRSARMQVIVYDKHFDIDKKPWIRQKLVENGVEVGWRAEFRLNNPDDQFNKKVINAIKNNAEVVDTIVNYKNINDVDKSPKMPSTENFIKYFSRVLHYLHYYDVSLDEVFDDEFEKYAQIEYRKFKSYIESKNVLRDPDSFKMSIALTIQELQKGRKTVKNSDKKRRSKQSKVQLRKYVANIQQDLQIDGKIDITDQKQHTQKIV